MKITHYSDVQCYLFLCLARKSPKSPDVRSSFSPSVRTPPSRISTNLHGSFQSGYNYYKTWGVGVMTILRQSSMGPGQYLFSKYPVLTQNLKRVYVLIYNTSPFLCSTVKIFFKFYHTKICVNLMKIRDLRLYIKSFSCNKYNFSGSTNLDESGSTRRRHGR